MFRIGTRACRGDDNCLSDDAGYTEIDRARRDREYRDSIDETDSGAAVELGMRMVAAVICR